MPSADSLNRKGAELFHQGDLDGARAHYIAALKLDPGWMPALANLGLVYGNENNLLGAEMCYRRLTAVVPHNGDNWINLGNILARQEKFEDAHRALAKGAEISPDNSAVWYNLALLTYRRGNPGMALGFLDRVEGLRGKDDAQVQSDRAHILLTEQKFQEAWPLYEARWEGVGMLHLPPWDFHIPEWKGEDLQGKKILIHAEQGFGDTLMTIRFWKDLVALGAEVGICVPLGLKALLEFQDWPVLEVLDFDDLTSARAKKYDFQSPLYGVMRWLGVEAQDISGEPYLIPPAITSPQLPNVGEFNIGICWASGKRGNEFDWRRRHAPLEHFLPLYTIPGVHLWSLQLGEEAGDITRLGFEPFVSDETGGFKDWAATAAFMDRMDLVISVDTAVAHLSAAMGKDTIMLSQYIPCWRWWNLKKGSGAPWYNTMRILSQDKPNDWAAQLETCRLLLERKLEVQLLQAAE